MADKKFTCRELTKRGFVHVKEEDFTDDGARFSIYEFEGVKISYTKYNEFHYISIRTDSMRKLYEYKDFVRAGGYALTDEFNGVAVVDVDKLVSNMKAVKALIEDLNKKAEERANACDPEVLKGVAKKEATLARETAEKAKEQIDWYTFVKKCASWEVKSVVEAIDWLENEADKLEVMKFESMEEKNFALNSISRCGYIKVKSDNVFIKKLEEALIKHGVRR